jgi:hypothetical protein
MTDQQYHAIMSELGAIRAALKGGAHAPSAAGGQPAAGGPKVASNAELNGPNGDPVVKFPPKQWKGENFKGKHFSECSAEFLLVHAEFLEWKGANPLPGKETYAKYDLLDAARARGWAAQPEIPDDAPAAGTIGDDSDSIPF